MKTLDKERGKLAQSEAYREAAGILRCFYGINTLTAITIIPEVPGYLVIQFAFTRFSFYQMLCVLHLNLARRNDSD